MVDARRPTEHGEPELTEEDLEEVVHALRRAFPPDEPVVPRGELAAFLGSDESDEGALATSPAAGVATLDDHRATARRRRGWAAAATIAGTTAGKIVIGATAAAALATGGLQATGVIDLPVLPGHGHRDAPAVERPFDERPGAGTADARTQDDVDDAADTDRGESPPGSAGTVRRCSRRPQRIERTGVQRSARHRRQPVPDARPAPTEVVPELPEPVPELPEPVPELPEPVPDAPGPPPETTAPPEPVPGTPSSSSDPPASTPVPARPARRSAHLDAGTARPARRSAHLDAGTADRPRRAGAAEAPAPEHRGRDRCCPPHHGRAAATRPPRPDHAGVCCRRPSSWCSPPQGGHRPRPGVPLLAGGAVLAGAALVGVSLGLAHLAWRRWSWAVWDDAVELEHGVVVRHQSLVPFHPESNRSTCTATPSSACWGCPRWCCGLPRRPATPGSPASPPNRSSPCGSSCSAAPASMTPSDDTTDEAPGHRHWPTEGPGLPLATERETGPDVGGPPRRTSNRTALVHAAEILPAIAGLVFVALLASRGAGSPDAGGGGAGPFDNPVFVAVVVTLLLARFVTSVTGWWFRTYSVSETELVIDEGVLGAAVDVLS
ncbi:MAG: hypothetical protein U5R31_00900 [Acidimicrobiia bacterium]|nr:hypothetical protein [Acidimicrobiia bacterium]